MFTVTVNTLADVVDPNDQYTSLREAVAHATDHSVTFDPLLNGGRIVLTAGPLNISKAITINGPGADKLTIDAAGASRVMSFAAGFNVTLSGLSITGGNSVGGGGGIFNSANLTLTSIDVSGNVTDTSGGGIHIAEGGKLAVYSSTIHDNRSGNLGGGIGGILNSTNALQVVGSTVSNNASLSGGGIGVSAPTSGTGSFLISRSTITQNLASNGIAGGGGGISYTGPVTATSHGSIIAGNKAFVADNDDINGAFVAGSTHNVVGRPGNSGFIHNTYGNRVGTNAIALDPKLSPLDYHGGPTSTHVPLPGSPALDAGGPETQYTPLTDQRGFKRLAERPETNVYSPEDIGAVELSSTVGPTGDFNGDHRVDQLLFDPTTNSLSVAVGAATAGKFDVEQWNVMPGEVTALSTFIVGDFNGDGRDDLLIRSGNIFRIAISDGSTFIDQLAVLPTTWTHIYTGDFDGDGSDEILGGVFSGGSNYSWSVANYIDAIGLIAPASVTIAGFLPSTELFIQDANGDAREDLITRVNSSSPWMVSVANAAVDGSLIFQLAADWNVWINAGFSAGALDADKALQKVIEQFSSVYNNVELELYPGLMKGPTATQQTKAGNNWDQAALLESQLQSLPYFGVNDVKIASGKVRATIAQFRDWLGLKSTVAPTQVLGIIRASLDNAAAAVDGSGTIISTNIDLFATAIEFTHAWVQARVPTASGMAWVNLDPSWKFKDRQNGIPLPANLNTTHTSQGLFDEFSYIRQPWTLYFLPVEFFEDELMKWIGTNATYTGSTLAEVAYDGPIKPKYLHSLPSGLSDGMTVSPGATISTYESFDAIIGSATLRNELTHRVTVQLKKGVTAQWTQPVELIVPSVSLDAINITFANSVANISNPNLIATTGPNYFGRLVVDGAVLSSAVAGQSFLASDTVTIEVKHLAPTKLTALTSLLTTDPKYAGPQANDQLVRFTEKPGKIISLGLEANQHSRDNLVQLQAELLAAIAGDTTEAQLIQDVDLLVSYTSAKYWADYNRYNDVIASLTGTIGFQSWVGSGIAKADPTLLQAAGGVVAIDYLPYGMAPAKFGVDLPNSNFDVVSIHTGGFHSEAWQLVGYNASALEHQIVEEVISSESISTMKGLKRSVLGSYGINAAGQSVQDDEVRMFESRVLNGVRTVYHVYNISSDYPDDVLQIGSTGGQAVNESQFKALLASHANATGIDATLWNFLSGASQEVGINDGPVTVMVPKNRTKLDSWVGAVYVAEMPANQMRFIIQPDGGPAANGGYSGGVTTAPPPELQKGSFTNATWAGDPVNTANGNMFRDETDIVYPNIGVPLTFSRHYDSQSKDDVGMGVGWTYSFSDMLYLDDHGNAETNDDEVVWIASSGARHRFKKLSGGSYLTPSELKGTLIRQSTNEFVTGGFKFVFLDASGMEYHFQEINDPHPYNGFNGPYPSLGRLRIQKDELGNGVQIEYINPTNYHGFTEIRDLHNSARRLVFDYGTAGRISTITKYDGVSPSQVWTYTYIDIVGVADSEKRLATSSTPSVMVMNTAGVEAMVATTVQYAYFNAAPGDPAYAKGLMKKITEADGAWHAYEYFRNGRVFRVKQGEYGVAENSASVDAQTFDYNLFRSQTEFTDERGNVETYLHGRSGLLYKQIHSDRSRLEYIWGSINEWDESLMKVSIDERGREERFTYYVTDSVGGQEFKHKQLNFLSVVDPFGPSLQTSYDYVRPAAKQHIARLSTAYVGLGYDIGDRRTTYTYDSVGRLTSQFDAEGHLTNGTTISARAVTRTYYPDDDAIVYRRGLLKSIIQPAILDASGASVSHETVFDYDAAGNVFKVTTGAATTTSYYDSMGNVGRSRGPTDIVTDSLYDALGRLRETGFGVLGTPVFNPIDAYTSSFKYDASGRVRESTDANGRKTQMEYDRQGNVVREVLADGSELLHEYDSFGNRIKSTDAQGVSTRFIYDNRNRLNQTVYADGAVVSQRYDGAGKVVATIDALQNVTTYKYDGLGRLRTTTQPDPDGLGQLTSPITTNKYNLANDLVETIDPEGNVTQFKYDRLARVIQTLTIKGLDGNRNSMVLTPAAGQLRSLSTIDYDAVGNVIKTASYDVNQVAINLISDDARIHLTPANIAANKVQVVSLRYDAFGRVVRTINADSTQTNTTYNGIGQVRYQYDELNRVTELQYDQFGRQVRTIHPDPDGGATAYSSPVTTNRYDGVGNLIATIDPRGFTTRYEYDAFNRLIGTTDANGNRERALYDVDGQLIANVDALGRTAYTLYDDRGRAIQQRQADPDGAGSAVAPVIRNVYDVAGRLVETIDPLGYSTTYQRDRLGRVVKETFVSDYRVVDSTSAAFTIYSGTPATVSQPGDYGGDSKLIAPGSPNAVMIWNFAGLDPGIYRVFAHWSGNASATTNLIYRLSDYYDEANSTSGSYWPEDVPATSVGSQRVTSEGQLRSEDGAWHQWKVLNTGFQIDAHGPTLGVHFAAAGSIQADAIRIERIASRSFSYDANGNLLQAVDPRGNGTVYTYDELNRVVTETLPDPDGGAVLISPLTTTSYDGYGNVISVVERRGNGTNIRKTAFEYDARNQRTKEIRDADNGNVNVTYLNRVTTFDYDDVGNLIEKIELPGQSLQRRTTYAYDNLDRIKEETRNAGAALAIDIDVTKTFYDQAGNVSEIQRNPGVDPRQIKTTFRYDALGQQIEQSEIGVLGVTSSQRTTRFQYDAVGNQIAAIDPLLRVSRSEFDRLDRRTAAIEPDPDRSGPKVSDKTTFVYNEVGQVLSKTNASNETERFAYDAQGRIIRSIDGRGDVTTRQYDVAGNLTKIVDPAGNLTSYAYDALDRKLSETTASGTRTFIYDANGNLKTSVDRNQTAIRYSYDRIDQSVRSWEYLSLADADALNQSFIAFADDYHDELGRLVEQRYTRRPVYAQVAPEYRAIDSFKYDGLNRLLEHSNQTIQADGLNSSGPAWKQTYSYAYDSVGLTVTRQEYVALQLETTTISNVDQFGSIWKLTDLDATGAAGIDFGSRSARFTYDASGALSSTLRLTNFSVLSPHQSNNHVETTYGYDGAGRLSSLAHRRTQYNGSPTIVNTAELLSYAYTYDDASRITTVDTNWNTAVTGLTTRIDSQQLFDYDLAGQLEVVSVPTGDEEAGLYIMTVNGRRSMSSDASGFLQNSYGADNRLGSDSRRSYAYDAEGNLTRVDSLLDNSYTRYYWDHRNRLTKAEVFDANEILVETITYRYNAANDLIYRAVTPAGQATQAEYYVIESGQRAMTIEADGDVKRRYQYGSSGEVLFDQVFNAAGAQTIQPEQDVLEPLSDHQGSTRVLLNGDDLTVRQSMTYAPFGLVTAIYDAAGVLEETSPDVPDLTALDTAFGHHGSLLDIDTGLQKKGQRWYAPEQGRFVSEDPIQDGSNWYMFAGNDPVNYGDPTGLIQEGHPLMGGYSGGRVTKPTVKTGSLGILGGLGAFYQGAKALAPHLVSGANKVANAIRQVAQDATDSRMLNSWLSHDSIMTPSGRSYFGGRSRNFSSDATFQQKVAAMHQHIALQNEVGGHLYRDEISLESALYNQTAIRQHLSDSKERGYQEWLQRQPTTWDKVKLWDNDVVARNVANQIDQGASIWKAVYVGAGTAIADNVGVSSLEDARSGRDFDGNRLTTGQRVLRGALGGVQLVGSAAGLRAPVMRGGQAINGLASRGGAGAIVRTEGSRSGFIRYFDEDAVIHDLGKSAIGREVLNAAQSHKFRLEFANTRLQYGNTEFLGMAFRRKAKVFLPAHSSNAEVALTAVHEGVHMLGVRGSQRAEVLARAAEVLHGGGTVSRSSLLSIYREVRSTSVYSRLPTSVGKTSDLFPGVKF